MKLTAIDKFEEEGATCFLCRTSLAEYVKSLNSDFKDYYVQRGIVSNRFLDNLWDTISKKRHIPSIVLVVDGGSEDIEIGQLSTFSNSFKVLDGLQRSNRIKEAWDAALFYKKIIDDAQLTPIRLARRYSEEMKAASISSPIFQRIVQSARDGADIISLFETNNIWLELWFNLTNSQQIQKMLVLNAGHKSVNIKHQVELLFISYLPILQSAFGGARIVREREKSSLAYSKARQPGEFHFAHLISAFVSLNEGKPITTNANFSADKSFEEVDDGDSLLGTDDNLLAAFARLLSVLDQKLNDNAGVKWLGREVVLVGLFGAIGAYGVSKSISREESLGYMSDHANEFVDGLNLESFESERNSLDLSKVNLGAVNRAAVYQATIAFLERPSPSLVDWSRYFKVAA